MLVSSLLDKPFGWCEVEWLDSSSSSRAKERGALVASFFLFFWRLPSLTGRTSSETSQMSNVHLQSNKPHSLDVICSSCLPGLSLLKGFPSILKIFEPNETDGWFLQSFFYRIILSNEAAWTWSTLFRVLELGELEINIECGYETPYFCYGFPLAIELLHHLLSDFVESSLLNPPRKTCTKIRRDLTSLTTMLRLTRVTWHSWDDLLQTTINTRRFQFRHVMFFMSAAAELAEWVENSKQVKYLPSNNT